MKLLRTLQIAIKSAREARWSGYQFFSERIEVFKVLFRLRYKTEFSNNEQASQKIFGYQVSGPSYKEMLYLFQEIFFEKQYQLKLNNARPLIIDAGSNIGMATLYFKRTYPDSQIIAFEPNPVVFEYLKKNITENGISGVEIINAALSDQEGTMDFFVDQNVSLLSSVDRNRATGGAVTVQCHPVSKFVDGKKVDLAKIDIEGGEWGVMKDLDSSQKIHDIENYIIEYHHNIPKSDLHLSKFLEVFEKNGFRYNLKTTYFEAGQFQDVSLLCYKQSGTK